MSTARALEALRAELAGRSYRITKQRMAIVEEFAALGRYVTAKSLHARLARKRSGIGLATVYRTLETLREIGAASAQAQAAGETAYLFCPAEHHHHAVCTKCGTVEDVPCRSVNRFARTLDADLRFTLTQHRLEFFGVCARCS
jgi:Fur family transcriptional regulator, ferric uptake regulator